MSQKKIKKAKSINKPVLLFNENGLEGLGVVQIIKEGWKFLTVISILVILLYINGMRADFVSDDYASISQNPLSTDWNFMVSNGNSATIANYIIGNIFGTQNSLPYHVVSLIFYIIFIWTTYIVLRKILPDIYPIMIGLVIFAVHPIHVEAVTWISGRWYVITSIYLMWALWAFIRFVESRKLIYILITIGLFVISFLTDKPRPFSLFLLIGIYMLYRGFRSFKVDYKKLLALISGVAILFVIFATPYIKYRIDTVNSGYNDSGSIFYNPFFQYPTGLSKYFQLLTIPIDLTLYHTMYVFPVWLNWLILGLYFVITSYFFFKNKKLFFCLAFILVTVLPSIMPVKVSWLVAERYIFWGSLGFCIFLGYVLYDLRRVWKFLPVMLLAIVTVLFSVRTYTRNIDWQTNHNLWVNTCQVSPNSHNAWNNIGDDYDKLKDYSNAIKGFTQSTIVKPNYADAFHNRANIFYKIGRLDLARDSYMTALSFSPSLYHSYLSLIQIDLAEGRLNDAFGHTQTLLNIQPDNPQSWYVGGVVLAQAGRKNEAIQSLKKSLALNPEYSLAKDALINLEKQ